jgi:uncharacterized membrane protein YgaE (UPF0421/DUF939 family)
MKIGYRVLKTAVGVALAVAVAQYLQLENYTFAGIIALLSIRETKKRSVVSSIVRLFTALIGMGLCYVFFELLTYHPLMIAVLLLFFIPLLVKFKLQEGIVTSIVIILHLYTQKEINFSLLAHELAAFFIGVGIAMLVNLYMPNATKDLNKYKKQIEGNFQRILSELAVYLRAGDSLWAGKEMTETPELLEKAQNAAIRYAENQLTRQDDRFYVYFRMREKQFEIIERLLPIVTSLPGTVEQGRRIATFLEELSAAVSDQNTTDIFLSRLRQMRAAFRDMPLPKTREEFEARAALYHFCNEIEQYLLLKSRMKAFL